LKTFSTVWMRIAINLILIGFVCTSTPAGAKEKSNDPDKDVGLRSPHTPSSYPAGSVVATTAPIQLPGMAGVTDTGQATYTIPLWIPDSPLKPRHSLAYVANANGLLGVGMSITGLSTIVPCRQTVAADGIARGIRFDQSDAYCLDGQKLVSGGELVPDVLTAKKVTYHTETETFQRVVAEYDDAHAPQPARFIVWRPNGEKATYEPRFATRLQGVNSRKHPAPLNARVAPTYPIATLVDRTGHKVTYEYEEEPLAKALCNSAQFNGNPPLECSEFSYRIAHINYSFTGSTAPRRRLRFVYDEARPDPIVVNVSGVHSVIRSRLWRIEVYAPNPVSTEVVWSYVLKYEQSTDTLRSLLSAVTLCDQTGQCSWSKKFEWTQPSPGDIKIHTVSDDEEFNPNSLSRLEPSRYPTDVRLMLFDVDGDGIDDAVYRTWWTAYQPSPAPIYTEDSMSQALYYQPGRIYLRRSKEGAPLASRTEVTGLFEPYMWQAHLGKSRVADLNGDGIPDLLLARTRVDLGSSGSSFGCAQKIGGVCRWFRPAIEDFTNYGTWDFGYTTFSGYPWDSGLSDTLQESALSGFVWRDSGNGQTPFEVGGLTYKLFTPPFQRVLADLDGDGRTDRIDVFENQDLFNYLAIDWSSPNSYSSWSLPYVAHLAADPATARLFPTQKVAWSCNNGQMIVGDVDGDGRDDVLAATDNIDGGSTAAEDDPIGVGLGLYRRMFMGDGLDAGADDPSKLRSGDCRQHLPDIVLADFNGDGLPDMLYLPNKVNEPPRVRWNLGNGYGPLEVMWVSSDQDGGQEVCAGTSANECLTSALYQRVPIGENGLPLGWDRGTRAVDVNGDGRTDLVAFRVNALGCDDVDNYIGCETLSTVLIVYLSAGDHFEAKIIQAWNGDGGVSLAQGFTTAQVGDVTGDGVVDIVQVVNGKLTVLELPWRTQSDRLRYVSDTGVAYPLESFTYTRSWWGDRPRPVFGPCEYPTACVRRGFTVVQQHTTFAGTQPNGKPMYRTRQHTYWEPLTDLAGRGFLGFALHRTWDVGLGQETTVEFDNKTRRVINETQYSYPYVGLAKTVTTITPLAPAPTQTQLEISSVMPGFGTGQYQEIIPVAVRVSRTTREYEVKTSTARLWESSEPSFGDRVITVLPSNSVTTEWETEAKAVLTNTPAYVFDSVGQAVGWDVEGVKILTSRTGNYDHDAYGNVTHHSVETDGGVYRRIRSSYDNRINDWLIRLKTEVKTRSDAAPSTNTEKPPTRIVRYTYYPSGLVETVTISARGPLSKACVSPEAAMEAESDATDPDPCEETATTTTFTRDDRGLITDITVVAVDEPLPRTTHITYDSEGVYPAQLTDGLGFTTTTQIHPALGVPVLTNDEIGVTTHLKYDGFGRLRESTRPGAAKRETVYYEWLLNSRRGIIAVHTAEDGRAAQLRYDELARPIESWLLGPGNQWIVSSQEYSAFGFLGRASRPGLGKPGVEATSYTYDRLGRTLARVGPNVASTTFEYIYPETRVTDPKYHTTYTIRDRDGHVIESGHLIPGEQGPQKYGVLTFDVGHFDQVRHVTDAKGNVTTLQYDALGRRIAYEDSDSGVSKLKYNGFGEVVSTTTADSLVTTRQYDVLGRLVHTTGSDGETTFVWDAGFHAAGRLVSSASPDGVVSAYDYDAFGRLKESRRTVGGELYRVNRTYDSYGRLRHLLYPEVSGWPRLAIRYKYDDTGYLGAVENVTGCPISLDGEGDPPADQCFPKEMWRVISRSLDLAVEDAVVSKSLPVQRSYSSATGRLAQIAVPGTGQVLTYHYDDDGNMATRIDAKSGRTETFTHDDLHRLTGWNISAPRNSRSRTSIAPSDTRYTYDELGNLLSVTVDGSQSFSASYGLDGRPHTLDWSSVDGMFSYDSRGRQEAGGGRGITYSQFDLPREITDDQGAVTAFEYDSMGVRASKIRKAPSQAVTVYVDGLYERRIQQGEEVHAFFVGAEPGVVAQVTYSAGGASTRYVVSDPLNSAILILDEAGEPVENSRYDPFGARVNASGSGVEDADPTTTFGFTGHEHDDDRLINMRGRIYDRGQYRFLTPDPIVAMPLFGQSYNPYAYAMNNPLRYTDPTGYSPDSESTDLAEPEGTPIVFPEDLIVSDCVGRGSCGDAAPDPRAGTVINSDQTGGSAAVTLSAAARTAVREGFAAHDAAGNRLKPPLNLYSGAGEAKATAAPGYTIKSTAVYPELQRMARELELKKAPWPEIRESVWVPASRELARNAALSETPITSNGLDTHPDPSKTVQAEVEIPAAQRWGLFAGGLQIGSGALSIFVSSRMESGSASQGVLALSGVTEVTGGIIYGSGAILIDDKLMMFGSRIATTGSIGAAVVGTAGAVAVSAEVTKIESEIVSSPCSSLSDWVRALFVGMSLGAARGGGL
jgi:RHS repeat-associated protein